LIRTASRSFAPGSGSLTLAVRRLGVQHGIGAGGSGSLTLAVRRLAVQHGIGAGEGSGCVSNWLLDFAAPPERMCSG